FLISFLIRDRLLPVISSSFSQEPVPLRVQLKYGFLYGTLIIFIVFAFERLYTKRFAYWEEIKHLARGLTLSFVLLMMFVFISREYERYSRAVLLMTWFFSLMVFPVIRINVKKLMAKSTLWKKKIFIIGTNELARLVAAEINKNKSLGYEIAGFLAHGRNDCSPQVKNSDIVGGIADYERLSEKMGVRDVIVALSHVPQEELLKTLILCEKSAESIRIVPRLGNIFTMGVEVESFGDILSLSVARNLTKPWNIFLKGIFEFVAGIILALIFLPLFIGIGIAIKLTSPGPIFYVQSRLGGKKGTFRCYKFRTMYLDSEDRLKKYLQENPGVRDEWEKYRKLKSYDPRVTSIGRMIRRFSLDELPNFINFFKREMNLVGPRPYMPEEKDLIGESYEIISRVKPGITGLWQVRGRNLLTFRDRVLLDEYYVRNWSLWLDLIILLKTIKVFVTREGAY
ncbi:MAG: undecaprenyl-phosphate galactose phosphotransferase WbaP, partial [Candidatus Aminicenantales bacterium]